MKNFQKYYEVVSTNGYDEFIHYQGYSLRNARKHYESGREIRQYFPEKPISQMTDAELSFMYCNGYNIVR